MRKQCETCKYAEWDSVGLYGATVVSFVDGCRKEQDTECEGECEEWEEAEDELKKKGRTNDQN